MRILNNNPLMAEIPCTVQPINIIQLDDDVNSGCAIIDITFPYPSGVKISGLSFTNYYVASITIKGNHPANVQQTSSKSKTILKNFVLMKHPHYSNESQNQINITSDDMLSAETDSFVGLTIIVRQPSPNWMKFNLENIKFYQCKPTEEIKDLSLQQQISTSENKSESNCFEDLREHMSKLNDMSQLINNTKVENKPGSFDVDGSYDINLLSYS